MISLGRIVHACVSVCVSMLVTGGWDYGFLLSAYFSTKNSGVFFCSTIDFLNAYNRVKLSSWSNMSFLEILSFPFFLMLFVIIFTVGFLSFKIMQKVFLVFQSIMKTDIIHINKFSMMIYMFNLFIFLFHLQVGAFWIRFHSQWTFIKHQRWANHKL